MKLLAALAIAFSSTTFAAEKDETIPADYRLLVEQDLKAADVLKGFVFSDPAAWKWSDGDGKTALELHKQSAYKPVHRSPFNIALLGDRQFGDFILEAQCLQTGKEYGHRDMVFVFGFQEPSKFYYVHIATKADDHANQVFIVNDAPRTKISKTSNDGNTWGLGVWRKVRIERKGSAISVFFDDMSKPIMTADDKTFGAGWIGFGSFDDTGKIANIRIWGKDSVEKKAPEFPKGK